MWPRTFRYGAKAKGKRREQLRAILHESFLK
jgi:hypothetical protein